MVSIRHNKALGDCVFRELDVVVFFTYASFPSVVFWIFFSISKFPCHFGLTANDSSMDYPKNNFTCKTFRSKRKQQIMMVSPIWFIRWMVHSVSSWHNLFSLRVKQICSGCHYTHSCASSDNGAHFRIRIQLLYTPYPYHSIRFPFLLPTQMVRDCRDGFTGFTLMKLRPNVPTLNIHVWQTHSEP